MPDPQQRLPHHLHVVLQQQIEVFQHRAGQAVLNGNRRGIGLARIQCGKHLRRKRARHNLCAGTSFSAASWLNEPGSP